MIRLFPTHTNNNPLSLKQLFLVFFICASVATWIGISTIQADEVDPGDYQENTETDFQNAAQEQHSKNIAIQAGLQDEAVIAAIESGDDEAARSLFDEKVAGFMQEISDRRAAGEGWGYIARDLGVHPGYLGLGHFKNKEAFAGQNDSSQKIHEGFALGLSKDKGGANGVGNGHGNGGGNGGGRGGGKK